MTLAELCREVATRLNDTYQNYYSENIVKAYLLKAMDVVLTNGKMSENDYSGLIKNVTISLATYDFTRPIRDIKAIFGDNNKNTYSKRTIEFIADIRNEKHLLPKKTEGYYYLVGTMLNIVPPLGDMGGLDETMTVYYVDNPSDTGTTDLSTIYSDYFIELSIREAMNRMLAELDTRL